MPTPRSWSGMINIEGTVYTIGFGMRNSSDVSTVQRITAREALKFAEALQITDEEIKFIDTPTDGRVGVEMLRVLAGEED